MVKENESVSDDNRAVSPVIGVILMVAITVILAAVIGTFVLGLGDSLNQTPQAQLEAGTFAAAGNDAVELSHNGGDPIPMGDLDIKFDGGTAQDFAAATDDTSDGADTEFSVGSTAQFSSATLGADNQIRVQVIHTPSNSILLDTTVKS